MSSEEHGWLSPVFAREAGTRAALAARAAMDSALPLAARPVGLGAPLLLPFDAHARRLLQHGMPATRGLPFT